MYTFAHFCASKVLHKHEIGRRASRRVSAVRANCGAHPASRRANTARLFGQSLVKSKTPKRFQGTKRVLHIARQIKSQLRTACRIKPDFCARQHFYLSQFALQRMWRQKPLIEPHVPKGAAAFFNRLFFDMLLP